MGGDGFGWVGFSGMGENGCSEECWERQLWPGKWICLPSSFIFGAFSESSDGSQELLRSDWAPWLQIDVSGATFGASRPDFRVSLGGLC